MNATTLSSREFNQDSGAAKKAAKRGPVFITDRGRPAHVLLSIEHYQQLVGGPSASSIVDMLAMPEIAGAGDLSFDPPRAGELLRPAELPT